MSDNILEIRCPQCNSSAKELIVCDLCQIVGCTKCVTIYNKQWVCGKCRSGRHYPAVESSAESALASMFG